VPTATVTKSGSQISSIATPTNGTYNFGYGTGGRGTDGHLTCVTEPGQSGCTIANTYNSCDAWGSYTWEDPNFNGSRDQVTAQTFATGETISYSHTWYQPLPLVTMNTCRGNASVTMIRGDGSVTVSVSPDLAPYAIQDELGRISMMGYAGPDVDYANFTRPNDYIAPEGNRVEFTYDMRGNVTETRRKAKTGSTEADIVTTATYPASCSGTGLSRKNCNKPLTVVDARGNTTSYTYSPDHGGVLTETGPAVQVNGTGTAIQPKKRYHYEQRYAWIKNAGGSFSQASSPVWVLVQERSCRTTATTTDAGNATGCAGGSSDEVVTSYDYGTGSSTAGNNLWLRGKTVSAWDTASAALATLRTCYGYDSQGNKIWETAPRAGLSACY